MLSSTFRDLTAHRDAVLAAMPSYDMLPVAMEYDAALPAEDLISASLKKVELSDAYVGIIGYRYGQIPICPERNPLRLSLAELEFRRAVELKKPICTFLMSPTHQVPAGDSQGEGRTKAKRAAFRKLAAKGRIYAEFDSLEDLPAQALLSLHELQKILNGAPPAASRLRFNPATDPAESAQERPNGIRAFLCHASPDKEAVRQLYRRLQQDSILPWLDEEELLPGQDWALEIKRAITKSDVVIACISKSSVTKFGFVQKEIKHALDLADERPEGAIFLIPIRLEECEMPERLRRLHYVDVFREGGYERLLRALRAV
jgi:hypothetical protein